MINPTPPFSVIHPDKCAHARAPEAFDILKKVRLKSSLRLLSSCSPISLQAESDLSDKAKREEFDAVITQARNMVLKALNLPTSISDSDPRLLGIEPPYKFRVRAQSKELLIEEEVRRRKFVWLFQFCGSD